MYLNLTLLLLLLSFVFPAQSDSDSVSEIRSLLEFKKGIHADPLEKVGSWNQSTFLDLNTCPQTWYGVVCDDSGYVAAIVLDGLQLSGELKFYTLIGLKNLKNLSLSGNFFTGRLVPALGSMTSLKHLDLSFNGFYGPIPSRINDMYNLNSLNLSSNNFKGGFPNGIRNLNQLKALDLHGNRLWGDIVDVLLELRNVEYVDLSSNSFYGVLPADPKNVSSLANTVRYLNLSHNKLNGEFFSSGGIQLFHNLEVLDLSNNQLSGELPSIGPLPNLRSLRLANNYLYGSVREELLESYIPLVELDLSGNGFTGSVHTINSTTLNFLNLSSNGISGSLPSSLGRCSIVDFSGNKISGDISIMHNWEANLEVLDLHSNKLSGSFPNLTFQFDKLATLNIRNNFLAGTLPSMLGSFPKLSFVDLSSNMFTGSIPRSFFASMTLTNLNLSFNHFSGAIPFQGSHASELLLLPSYPPLAILDLANNSLTGTLSSDIGQMGRLKLLNVSMNNLSSKVPNELCKLSELEYLDLSNNRFDGMIPNKLPPSLKVFNVSYNNLSGSVPENLKKFPLSSFHPGNNLLYFPRGMPSPDSASSQVPDGAKKHRSSKDSTKVAIIVGSVGASMMVAFVLFTYYRSHLQVFRGTSSLDTQDIERDVKLGRSRPSFLKFQANVEAPSTSLSFSHDHLLTSDSRTLSGTEQAEATAEIVEHILPGGTPASSGSKSQNIVDSHSITSGRESFHGSPLSSSPRFIEASEPPVMLDVHSPDRLAGELFFLDTSLTFTAEELSRAPAEVLGRSSHGTLYKATLENGHMLTVKWLRVGLVKHKKEFAKEVKKLGSIRHPNIVSLGAYYWGPREQERLILADYIHGDSLALHLYETTPRRYSPLSFRQRLKVAVDVVRCLLYLHDRGLPHGNLKPTNILLAGPDLTARLSDYGLHRLMTPAGMAEQILNMGALGYCDPELATAVKPTPSLKADVYAFGVILMELLTRRSAGDIISGQSGAVDLTDWVRLCDQEGRGMDCIDRDMAHGEEPSKAMDELLAVSLRCILPVNERPNIRQVFEDICSISA